MVSVIQWILENWDKLLAGLVVGIFLDLLWRKTKINKIEKGLAGM